MKIASLAAQMANAESIRAVPGSERQAGQDFSIQQPDQGGHRVTDASRADDDKISPEQVLDKIREISEDGLYSVRFEKNEELDELVVKLVDRRTDEVIRQIPPEAILGIKANLREFAGNIVNQAY